MVNPVNMQAAYILHGRPYRDTSLIIDIFSAQYGRLGLVARGARGPRSRVRGILQPFRRLLTSWSGRGELRTLVKAEENGLPLWLTGQALVIGLYLNELLQRLLQRDDPHPLLFERYDRTLQELADAGGCADPPVRQRHHERATRIFEKELLRELGYGLILDHEIDNGDPIDPDAWYSFDLSRGPVLGREPLTTARGARPSALQGASLLSLAADELTDARSLREAKSLLRAALALHLGGRPLNSRKLLPGIRRAPAAQERQIMDTDTLA